MDSQGSSVDMMMQALSASGGNAALSGIPRTSTTRRNSMSSQRTPTTYPRKRNAKKKTSNVEVYDLHKEYKNSLAKLKLSMVRSERARQMVRDVHWPIVQEETILDNANAANDENNSGHSRLSYSTGTRNSSGHSRLSCYSRNNSSSHSRLSYSSSLDDSDRSRYHSRRVYSSSLDDTSHSRRSRLSSYSLNDSSSSRCSTSSLNDSARSVSRLASLAKSRVVLSSLFETITTQTFVA